MKGKEEGEKSVKVHKQPTDCSLQRPGNLSVCVFVCVVVLFGRSRVTKDEDGLHTYSLHWGK